MATVVGSLQVDVTNGTATFTFDDAKKQIDGLASSAESAGSRMDYSMRESRESIMLTAEAMGVHLPAGITRVIASLGPLGEALAVALPVAAVVAGIALIVEHYEKLAEAMRKAASESANSAIKNADEAKGLDLTNLKLDDQIARLEHKPSHNYMAEAIIETSQAVDQLATKYASDFAQMDGLIKQQIGGWAEFKRGVKDAFTGVGQGQGYGTVTKMWTDLQDAMQNVNLARQNLAEAPSGTKQWTADEKALVSTLEDQQSKIAQLQVIYRDDKTALVQLGEQAKNTKSEIDNLSRVIDEGGKKKTISGLEQNAANLEPLVQELAVHKQVAAAIGAHEAAVRKLTETENEGATGGKEGLQADLAGIEANRQATIDAANADLAVKQETWAEEIVAAGNNAAKVQEIVNEHAAEQQAHNDTLNQADAAAKAATEKAKLAYALAAISQELDARKRLSQEQIKDAAEDAKDESEIQKAQMSQKESEIADSEKLGLVSKRQALQETIDLINQEGDARKKEIADQEKAQIDALQKQIDQEEKTAAAQLALNGGDKADPKYLAYLDEVKILQLQIGEAAKKANADAAVAQTQTNAQLQKTQADLILLNNSWSTYFAKMNSETNTLAATFRGSLQTSMTQAMNGFNNSIAKSIVEGKNFGQAMRQVAASFLESMIGAGLKWLENWIIQHTIAAAFANSTAASTFATQKAEAVSLAGANAVASFALAPWPIDMGAPAFGAAMAAAATGFNEGGIVPGIGNSDTVPAMLTPGETVLPQAMTEKLNSATSGAEEHHHWHYSPTNHIKAWDSSDIKDAMMSQKDEFIKQTRKEARRRHK